MRDFELDPGTVKVDWALTGPVPWAGSPAAAPGTVHVADSVEEMTQTLAQVASGVVPDRPFLLTGQMTTSDPSRSPAGTESFWAYTHVPAARGDAQRRRRARSRGRWDHDDLERFADRMQARIEARAPGFGTLVGARRVLGPHELEARNANLVGGAVNGGTSQLHQELVFRPVPAMRGRAATGVPGLFLGSASAHPGGGVHGAAGANAARAALWQRPAARACRDAAARCVDRAAAGGPCACRRTRAAGSTSRSGRARRPGASTAWTVPSASRTEERRAAASGRAARGRRRVRRSRPRAARSRRPEANSAVAKRASRSRQVNAPNRISAAWSGSSSARVPQMSCAASCSWIGVGLDVLVVVGRHRPVEAEPVEPLRPSCARAASWSSRTPRGDPSPRPAAAGAGRTSRRRCSSRGSPAARRRRRRRTPSAGRRPPARARRGGSAAGWGRRRRTRRTGAPSAPPWRGPAGAGRPTPSGRTP